MTAPNKYRSIFKGFVKIGSGLPILSNSINHFFELMRQVIREIAGQTSANSLAINLYHREDIFSGTGYECFLGPVNVFKGNVFFCHCIAPGG